MPSGTQRELSEELGRGRVEINGSVEVLEGGCKKGVRQDGDEVLGTKRAVVVASVTDRAKHS